MLKKYRHFDNLEKILYGTRAFSERAVRGGWGGYAARFFIVCSFPCSADHERD